MPDDKEIFLHLSKHLSNSELQSLLIEVYRSRALGRRPSRVLEDFRNSRFTRPSEIPQVIFNRFDTLAFSMLPGKWHSVELSPVTPLGTCTSLSNLSQNRMLSTIRNSEVVADSTSSLALEAAVLRKECLQADARSTQTINCCSSHRLLRAQSFQEDKFSAHFRVFSLVSAGRDTGNFSFELSHLEKHIRFYLELCRLLKILEMAEVHVSDFSGSFDPVRLDDTMDKLERSFPGAGFEKVPDRTEARNYYAPLAFRIRFTDPEGSTWDLVDGGFNNWTQLLLSNRKERILSSAIGSELLFRVFPHVMKLFG
jgi:hypothetical protein